MSGSSIPNNQKAQPELEVTITHAAHPHCGQKVVIVPRRGRKQAQGEIWIELPGGEQRSIPIEWTDETKGVQYPEGIYFPIEKLLELAALLDEVEEKQRQSIMAEGEGGESHGTGRNCELAANAAGTAPTDHCGAGGDTVVRSGSGDTESRGVR